MRNLFKRLFSSKEVDQQVGVIYDGIGKDLKATAVVAKSHADLLKKNGVTLQIYIATGAGKKR